MYSDVDLQYECLNPILAGSGIEMILILEGFCRTRMLVVSLAPQVPLLTAGCWIPTQVGSILQQALMLSFHYLTQVQVDAQTLKAPVSRLGWLNAFVFVLYAW